MDRCLWGEWLTWLTPVDIFWWDGCVRLLAPVYLSGVLIFEQRREMAPAQWDSMTHVLFHAFSWGADICCLLLCSVEPSKIAQISVGRCFKHVQYNILYFVVRGEVLGSNFSGYEPLVSQNPNPIIVYSVANYRPHLSQFWANVIVILRTEFNASRLLNIKTTAGTIF